MKHYVKFCGEVFLVVLFSAILGYQVINEGREFVAGTALYFILAIGCPLYINAMSISAAIFEKLLDKFLSWLSK